MNIVRRELRANFKSMILWSAAIAFIVAVWMIEYESFAGNPLMDDFMAAMPQGMLAALGMKDITLSSLEGFVSSLSLYLYLLLGIQAVLLGSSIISKEERDKTAEYLFSLPISRKKIIASKTLSAIIILLVVNLLTMGSMVLTTLNYEKEQDFYFFVGIIFLSVFILQMVFFSIGMFISSISKKYKKSGNVSVGILMITFLISSLISMVDSLDFLRFATPFKYFEADYIINQMSLEPTYIFLSLLIILLGISGTFIFYPKRDLYI